MTANGRAPDDVTLAAIFRVFVVIGITAFGGGASAHIHDAIVHRKKWIDEARMLEGMTLARVIPGTNVSNLAAFVGSFLAGYRGAIVAVCGVALPGVIIVVGLAIAYARFAANSAAIQTSLDGLTAGAVGIMASLVVNAMKPSLGSTTRVLFAISAFAGVAVLHLNLLLVLVVLMPMASWLEGRRGAA